MTKPRAVKVNADQHARAKEFVMKRARISLTTAAIAAVVQLAAGQALAADAASVQLPFVAGAEATAKRNGLRSSNDSHPTVLPSADRPGNQHNC